MRRGTFSVLVVAAVVLLSAVGGAGASRARTDIVVEGFEGDWPPAGWTLLHLGDSPYWERSGERSHGGEFSAWVHYGALGSPQDEWLVSPALDLESCQSAYLEFFEDEEYWSGFGGVHSILVGTSEAGDTAAFESILEMSPGDHGIAGFAGEPMRISLQDYIGAASVYIAFRYQGAWADDWYVDDVRVYEPYERDMAVREILPDGRHYSAGEFIEPTVLVENMGSAAASCDLRLRIDESGLPVYEEIRQVELLPGETLLKDFPALTAQAGHLYKLTAEALLADDEDLSNNSALAFDESYTQVHVPLGYFFTNAASDPCAPAGEILDAYLAGQGDSVALLRVHTSWPGSDPFHAANPGQADSLVAAFGVDQLPQLWIDGILDLGEDSTAYAAGFEARKAAPSPFHIDLVFYRVSSRLSVTVDVVEAVDPEWEIRLRVAVSEDQLYFEGCNGQAWHDQVFRRMVPDCEGLLLESDRGRQTFLVDCPLEDEWVYARLRATVSLRDAASGRVWQAASRFLSEITDPTGLENDPAPAALLLEAAYPNPFNPCTTLSFVTGEPGRVRLRVFDSSGREVRALLNEWMEAGPHRIEWDGRDAVGREQPGGIYLVKLSAPGGERSCKVLLAK